MAEAGAIGLPGRTFDQADTNANARGQLRRRLFLLLGAGLVVVALVVGGGWYLSSLGHVTTDDAYANASTAAITPQVNDPVLAVPVYETQRVKKGQVLVVLDASDQKIAVAQAEANLAQALSRVRTEFANAAAASAGIAEKDANLKRAELDYRRRASLASTGAVSGDELTAASTAVLTAKADLAAAQGQFAAEEAPVKGTTLATNPDVLAAQAALDAAKLNLARTVIRAPFDGVVAQKQVQIGQRVELGSTLMTIVPVTQIYVDANFKEDQLRKVHIGQSATLTSDLYGSGVVFHGHVVGLGGGTGSAFAVIPAQNATGNWIKVVQRLPVRIWLDPKELELHPLRVGLSMAADVNIAH